jgi:RAB6A-GEF complex partner protein 2
MSPYIVLRDMARTTSISSPHLSKPANGDSDLPDFLNYVDALLQKPQRSAGAGGLLSPTSPLHSPTTMRRHSSIAEPFDPRSMKEAIDFAILRSNLLASTSSSSQNQTLSNKFDIARSGHRVATLLLPRPAYRLGETLTLIIDLSNASIPVYALQIALETAERVDPAIAMRSSQSLYRYTRKVHAYAAESALFARRLSFSLSIPPSATPEFVTSGISLEWRVRVEFVTPRVSGVVVGEEEAEGPRLEDVCEDLLEEVSRDARGRILQGVETLRVETFEVAVPIRVYGAVVGGVGESDVEALVI